MARKCEGQAFRGNSCCGNLEENRINISRGRYDHFLTNWKRFFLGPQMKAFLRPDIEQNVTTVSQ